VGESHHLVTCGRDWDIDIEQRADFARAARPAGVQDSLSLQHAAAGVQPVAGAGALDLLNRALLQQLDLVRARDRGGDVARDDRRVDVAIGWRVRRAQERTPTQRREALAPFVRVQLLVL
jgi:hypothetical protein